MLLAVELKETRLAKLSFAGVEGFEGGVEEAPAKGVDRPDHGGVGRMAEYIEEDGGAGFLISLPFEDHCRPLRSSMFNPESSRVWP